MSESGTAALRRPAEEPSNPFHYGNVYYHPTNTPSGRRKRTNHSFPTPPIRPRARRPLSIHILSYPSGFIPPDLRGDRNSVITPKKLKPGRRQGNQDKAGKKKGIPQELSSGSAQRALETLFAKLSPQKRPRPATADPATRPDCLSTTRPLAGSRPVSFLSFRSRIPVIDDGPDENPMVRNPTVGDMLRPPLAAAAGASGSHRNSLIGAATRPAKSFINASVTEVQKPVATGSGVQCSIILAEPNLFLTGFEHDGHSRQESQNATALLRGKLQLKVSKNVKIKSVTLKLSGKARTEWPEGIPPAKSEQYEEETLRTQVLTFFYAMHNGWETEYGNQCVYTLKKGPSNDSSTSLTRIANSPIDLSNTSLHVPHSRNAGMTAKELKRLSLQSVNSRSFNKADSPIPNQMQAKGYKVFYPGTYEYSFELPIDHHQLETIKLQYGSVKWELETTVERAGAFKPTLHGTKEVSIVRVPDQLSLEMTEPISISRQWEDQLHYDIIISGKSFPIGSKIPIAFRLTPLAKVQVHKLKVFVTESIEYWTNDRKVTRKDPGRKILLLEKSAGKALDKQYQASEVHVLSGGELSAEERVEARRVAENRRTRDAQRSCSMPQPLPEPSENLLGDLDLGLESYWGSTEIEMNVQIPTCEMMQKDKNLRLNPDCSWKNVNVYHWIKLVMRISRADPDDPSGRRRRHFEISIDSPFTVLNCRATQANTSLPEYNGGSPNEPGHREQTSCGCPDATVIARDSSPSSSTGTLPITEIGPDHVALPMPPQAAHLASAHQGSGSPAPSSHQPRPMHLLRYPSFNPPAFDADVPPPALPAEMMTPPPQYDHIVGTPSVDGLADYFARLADYEEENEAEDSDSGDDQGPARILERSGRINVANPRTPGGHMIPSRSFEIERPPMTLSMTTVQRRGGGN